MASLTVAVLITFLPHPSAARQLQVALLRVNFFSALLLSELSVGIFALSVRSGLHWAAHSARIMQGLTAYFLSTLMLETARTYFGLAQGSHAYSRLAQVRILVYISCMAYWIVALWREPTPTREMPARMRQQLASLRESIAGRLEATRTVAKL